jgi:hypothetical protein
MNSTGVPGSTIRASSDASQFVKRTQPFEVAFDTWLGFGVP